jgi:hypothetical protein
MDRNHALTAMALADATSADAQTGHQLSMNIINYAAKLGPALEATSETPSRPERSGFGKDAQLSDPEAGG